MTDNQPHEATRPTLLGRVVSPRFNLAGALALAIAAALVIVAIAYALYWNNPNRKYDLARPGERDNLSVRVEDEEADTTSPVNEAAVKQKIENLTKELNTLGGISNFDPNDLNDQLIQLAPSEQPSL